MDLLALALTLVLGLLGGWVAKVRGQAKEIADLIYAVVAAIEDNKITTEEIKKILDEADDIDLLKKIIKVKK